MVNFFQIILYPFTELDQATKNSNDAKTPQYVNGTKAQKHGNNTRTHIADTMGEVNCW